MEKKDIFKNSNPVLTFDVDWAPDYMIDYVIKKLEKTNIKCTWFITHDSPAIQRLIHNPLFEIGLHPNFSDNSSQGNEVENILKELKKIVPNAKSIRTHGLFQSTNILLKFFKYGIQNDVSILFSNESFLKPHYSKYLKITRFPFYWEDDTEFNENNWENVEKHFLVPGLKIFNFHPVHIYLNSNEMKKYNELKMEKYPEIDEKIVEKYKNKSVGTNTFFEKLIKKLDKKETNTINEISNIFNKLRIN